MATECRNHVVIDHHHESQKVTFTARCLKCGETSPSVDKIGYLHGWEAIHVNLELDRG